MNIHEKALLEAEAWLESVDADEFLDDFLQFQEESCGPTINDFLDSLQLATDELFNLHPEIVCSPTLMLGRMDVSASTIEKICSITTPKKQEAMIMETVNKVSYTEQVVCSFSQDSTSDYSFAA